MIDLIKSVKDVVKDKKKIYAVLDALGVTYKKSTCRKCLKDLRNICLEELGLIENAAEESEFNDEVKYVWKYIYHIPVICNGVVYNQDTDPEKIESFANSNPNKFYVKEYVHGNNNNQNNEE